MIFGPCEMWNMVGLIVSSASQSLGALFPDFSSHTRDSPIAQLAMFMECYVLQSCYHNGLVATDFSFKYSACFGISGRSSCHVSLIVFVRLVVHVLRVLWSICPLISVYFPISPSLHLFHDSHSLSTVCSCFFFLFLLLRYHCGGRVSARKRMDWFCG